MAEPFIGEIRIIGFTFAPKGWAYCDGQLLPINQNQALYSLLGPTFGGDGSTTFAVPDLRGRAPLHPGNGYMRGQKGGAETVTLTAAEIATHTHGLKASSSFGDSRTPANQGVGNVLAAVDADPLYRDPEAANATVMRAGSVTNTGGGQAHDNMQPCLTLGFVIALKGLFPPRN